MVRAPCCEKEGVKKGPWAPEEDQALVAYIQQHGHDNWRKLPKKAGLLRCGKSCRLRWINYLRPDIKRGNFTKEEEAAIIELHEKLGNRWSAIAAKLPGRTDNEIKNVWHTHLKKIADREGAQQHKKKVRSSGAAKKEKKQRDAAMPTKPQAIRPLHPAAAASAGTQNCTSPIDGPTSPSNSFCSMVSSSSSSSSSAGVAIEGIMDSLEALLDVDVVIDESFWSEPYLSLESSSTGNDMMSDRRTISCLTSMSSPLDDSTANCGVDGDDMSYWLKVFMEAGEMTQDFY